MKHSSLFAPPLHFPTLPPAVSLPTFCSGRGRSMSPPEACSSQAGGVVSEDAWLRELSLMTPDAAQAGPGTTGLDSP
jgi:hypothetical protein